MSKNNVRIAIRDSTDSHNVAFFDNQAGIKYKSANLQRFLAGSASILTIKYNSKDIDTIRSGCKLAFRYKNRDYWLNVMSFEKKGFEVELTAYSLGLELNNETRGEHKPANAMSIAEYVAYYDPEHALTIGVNEVSDKRIKLEWTGTGTILARLFSVANSFGAELDFSVELNDDYSLKRQVLNIYKKGNLGTNKVSQPVRVGKELKVINYSDNIKELRTAVRATGKDGLTIDGLDKKIYDNNKELLYYSSGMTVYAPQSRDRFPSVGKVSNDNWIVEDLGETQYETKEALWGYMYGEIQKKSLPEITYEVEGAIEAGIGDTQTLIDDIHFEPALYVQARVSELEDDILTGKVTKSTFINFERKYSQIADNLLKQVEALAEDAAPYIIRLSTNNGYIFKNGEGSSTITARLEKYSKDIAATWKWVVDNKVVGTGDKLTVKAEQIKNTMAVTVIAYVNGNEVVRDYMTFSNSDDGVGVESIDRYFTSSDQSDGVTIEGAEWSDKPPAPTEDGKYLWAYDEITYTNGTVTTTKPSAVGANFDVDAFRAEIAEDLKDVPNREEFENKISEELANSKAEIETQIETAKTQAESNAKEYADTINQETTKVAELANAAAGEIKADLVNVKNNLTATSLVANNAQASVDKAKQDLANSVAAVNTKVDSTKAELTQAKQDLTKVTSDLNTAKQDLANSVAAVNTKVDSTKAELTQAKQDLTKVTSDLNTAKQDLANSVAAVNTKADSTKAELTQAKQDLTSHAQQLQTQANAQTELTKRVTTVETTANGTKTTVNELTKTVAQNGKDITSVTARTKKVEDDLLNTKTTLSQVKTTADSTSQKTATLETGLNGLSAKFENLKVGAVNLLKNSKAFKGSNITGSGTLLTETYNGCAIRYFKNTNPNSNYQDVIQFNNVVNPKVNSTYTISFWAKGSGTVSTFFHGPRNYLHVANGYTNQGKTTNPHDDDGNVKFDLSDEWQRFWVVYKLKNAYPTNDTTVSKHLLFRHDNKNTNEELWLAGVQLEEANIATEYSSNESDIESKVAEYKQNADQNYASLQTTVQKLDGTVQHNKTVAEQTAEGFKTRIESLETYKDGETTRANQYFESAKTETARQLTVERTAIAEDYVAKSRYTSDVAGIRNELSATTTTANTIKTNLANYQATNDRAVANLQSSVQTANGDISSLKTKVEAVPGQITSAVSAVESKIPTEIGTVNLLKNSKTFSGSNITGTGSISSETYQGCAVRRLKVTGEVAVAEFRNCVYPKLGGEYVASFWAKGKGIVRIFFYGENGCLGVASGLTSEGDTVTRGDGLFDFNLTTDWKRYWVKYKLNSTPSSATNVGKHLLFRTPPNGPENDVYLSGVQLEEGSVASGYEPSPEDTAKQISSLSSEIKQTADGMTLLATKTELNTAKSDLQSGISTATSKADNAQTTANSNAQTISNHTTQISALTTGLNAKVSQTDFNTLSGRVTTAENNIIAKANELSSKITTVEGKIPIGADGRNLWIQSKATGNFVEEALPDNHITGQKKCYRISNYQEISFNIEPDFSSRLYRKVTFSAWVKYKDVVQGSNNWNVFNCFKHSLYRKNSSTGTTTSVDNLTLSRFTGTSDWKYITYTYDYSANKSYDQLKASIRFNIESAKSGTAWVTGIKIELGSILSDYSPAPEDTVDQISSLSSQIKQTADGMTLLATKTELNSAKNELQSGINTATNKANTAQNTANSNAQTISTHTTQISALNTGLNAKVSQSDFNTLSGRVTTAENNITAKANELSSKISSVEGKIPTEIGSTNLLRKTAVNTENLKLFSKADTTVSVVEKDRHQVYKLTVSGSNKAGAYFGGNGDYYNLVKDRNYTFSFWVLTNKDKNYNMNSLGHIQAVNTNSDKVGNDPVHQHTQPVYSTSVIRANTWTKVWCTFKATSNSYFIPYFWYLTAGDVIYIYDMMLNEGKVPLSYTPAPEDTISQISSLSSELKQTADGITLLATKTELNSAKNELQSGINTATNKANSAQNTANSNAQTISTHTTQISALTTGLNAKVSQSDFNTLIGRVTTAENNITAKADELSSKISSVEGKLPSGETNLVDYGRPANGYSPYAGAEYTTHAFYYNSAYKMYIIRNTGTSEKLFRMNRFKVERNTDYTLYFKGFNNDAITNMDVWFLKRVSGSSNDYDSAQILVSGRKLSNGSAEDISVTFNTGNYDEGYLRFDNNGTSTSGSRADLYFGDVSVKKGKSNSGWSPSLAELASSQDLKTAQSEFKQTTDAIKASVSSLDKSTVKSSSLTINADGIVMKAGKSTTDVANAIGSYFSVNQNAINLFSDKINVKGSMIVSGAITSDKIASKQINTAHLNGKIITADVISSNAVTADAIKAGAVTTDKMSANSINGDRITAGTLDAAKIKAGSITASQIASGTITSEQIKAGTISAAKIAAGAITSDKIASNSIDASKIAAGAISANMITGGQLRSTNGATMFDLNAGTLTFNNNSGYIQRVAGDKIFAITTSLSKTSDPSLEYLTSAFQIRKSDNSRYAGLKFSLYNDLGNKPIATAKMNADEFILSDSKNTQIFSVCGKSSWSGTFNLQGWRDIPVAEVHGGLIVKDIGIGGHIKSLLKIVEELCNKTGIMWI